MADSVKTVPTTGELREDSPKRRDTWGPDDELSSVEYLTPDIVVQAARLVVNGTGPPVHPLVIK